MKLTRRNTVIGLAALAGGAGAINATGAFDAVEAERSFEVEVSGDAGALLGLSVDEDSQIAEYVQGGAGDNDIIAFDLDDDKVNENATTTFLGVLTVTNNGNQEVQVTIQVGADDDDVSGISFESNGNDDISDGDDLIDGIDFGTGDTGTFDLIIDTTSGGFDDADLSEKEITLEALSADAQ